MNHCIQSPAPRTTVSSMRGARTPRASVVFMSRSRGSRLSHLDFVAIVCHMPALGQPDYLGWRSAAE
jgi:hypothetical protein